MKLDKKDYRDILLAVVGVAVFWFAVFKVVPFVVNKILTLISWVVFDIL